MVDDDLAWQTIDRETAYTCPGFDVVHETVELPDGTRTDFDYCSEPPAVVILPLTDEVEGDGDGDGDGEDEDEVVVIEEWRQAVDRVNLGLPAGTVEPDDDDLEAAARRELREETGYEAADVEHLVTVEPANGIADSVHHHFVATGCTPTAEQALDADETIRVSTMGLGELRERVAAGSIRDGRAVTAVSFWALTS